MHAHTHACTHTHTNIHTHTHTLQIFSAVPDLQQEKEKTNIHTIIYDDDDYKYMYINVLSTLI